MRSVMLVVGELRRACLHGLELSVLPDVHRDRTDKRDMDAEAAVTTCVGHR